MKPLAHSYSSIKDYEQCPLKYQQQRIVKSFKNPPNQYSAHGERVHKDFENHVRDGTPLPPDLIKYAPLLAKFIGREVSCEREVVLTEELKPTTWWAPDAWLRGKLDLYVRLTSTTAAVFDWKTGKHRPDFDQMELFALFVWAHDPEIQEVRTALIWTQCDKMDTQTYTREADANRLWAKHLGKIRKIYESVEKDVWPAKPSGLCGYCGYQPQCVYGRK